MSDEIQNLNRRMDKVESQIEKFETAFYGSQQQPGIFEMCRRTGETVEKMNGTVESLREDRWKVKGALGASAGIGGAIGWLVSLFTSGK